MANNSQGDHAHVSPHLYLELKPYINRDNMLIMRMVDREGAEHPVQIPLRDRIEAPEIAEIIVRVCDFYHNRAVYRAYGISLDRDRRTIAAHWQPSSAETA